MRDLSACLLGLHLPGRQRERTQQSKPAAQLLPLTVPVPRRLWAGETPLWCSASPAPTVCQVLSLVLGTWGTQAKALPSSWRDRQLNMN